MIYYNYLCFLTLVKKEVFRFFKVGIQTVIGPAISSLLFLAVFSLALGRSVNSINGIDLPYFIAPGLIMMTMLQNSFANSASSIGQSKFQGNIVDILMAPLNNVELAFGFIIGSVCRGVVCGIVTTLGVMIFVPLHVHLYSTIIFYIDGMHNDGYFGYNCWYLGRQMGSATRYNQLYCFTSYFFIGNILFNFKIA